ncbi:hypothetical protein ASPVEDRAFT_45598 [Aspergillus versicolor CBS 583.65]|uniref:Uncharacterized protein n=1 Tax=Aspergillus versicolor CBS 583.65 TaxID=1036611 RepID=A0A1L9PXA8_ASPVE|nr:uncharacterized protein ASPVEDRAFT_45598 [Aspergillus versicolor CBS 583.65]OJJ06180.1 hypothetical protein ASPVEDRAFT_45598 [Aspergillus versicolor CBS 583.65]
MATLRNPKFQSSPSRTSKSIGHTTAPVFPSQYASLLDSITITPQEHSLLQELLASHQLQSVGSGPLHAVPSKPNNATSHASHDSNWNSHYSNSEENARSPQEAPHALGVLAEIADIERAWESWNSYCIS